MQIGIVLSASPGYSETFFNSKIKGLREGGHSVILFCQKATPDFSLCEVRQLPMSTNKKTITFKLITTFIKLVPYIKRVLKYYYLERKDNVSRLKILKKIYLNAPFFKEKLNWIHFGFGTLALGRENIAKALNTNMAVSFRGFDIGVYPLKHKNCYKKLWDKVDKIHVISNDIRALLYQNNFNDEAPVVKITPAIDVENFNNTIKVENNELLKLTTVARLHWKKGIDYTLDALKLLKERGVKFEYTIIGDGVDQEYLKFTVAQLNLETNVNFKGRLNQREIKKILLDTDIYLQYSVQEGFCNAVLEAQAMGILCVVSDAEGLSENIIDNQTGWVVYMRKANLLLQKIIEIINMPLEKKTRIRKAAQKRVINEFNLKKHNNNFLRFYD